MIRCALLLLLASLLPAADDYKPGPDSVAQEGVLKGELIKGVFASSEIFPGTTRNYTVYVPVGLDRQKAAPVMVFQDGVQYQAPHVFDNLMARKELPMIVGVFVTPGVVPALAETALDRFNRSLEYDGLGDDYARMVVKELLPHIAKEHGIKLTKDPNERAIAGASSGAIAAFTAAWERPDYFRRVFSSIGTYVGLRGGDEYPTLIRKTEPKPIRLFLQDGSGDHNIYCGNWFLANQDMLSSLEWAGYDVNHIWGDGGHNGKHATAIFPEAVKWLWRDYPAPITANPGKTSKSKAYEVVAADSQWELVGEGFGFTEGPAANEQGEVFFTDIPANKIHKIGLDGKVAVFAENTGGANGLMFGPDGRLYAAANGLKQIVAYAADGRSSVVAEGLGSNDLCITRAGNVYVTDPGAQQVWLVKPDGSKSVVDKGLGFPNGILLSPDQSLLYVADMSGQFVWSYQIQADGTLKHKQRYFMLHRKPDGSSGADGMTVDTKGQLYVATPMGIQICDQAGRVNMILPRPQVKSLSNVCFGGPDLRTLFVTHGDKIYKRASLAQGVLSGLKAPVKPEKPRL
jgi:gluconolactonase